MDALAVRPLLLCLLALDGLRHLRIVGIGGYTAVTLLDDRDFTGVGIGNLAVFLTHLRRLCDTGFRALLLLLGHFIFSCVHRALDQRGRTLRR